MTRRCRLVTFAASAVTSGWLGLGLNRLCGVPNTADSPGAGVWLVSPVATSLPLRCSGDSWQGGGLTPRLRESWPWYAVAVGTYPAVTAGVVLLGRRLGWVDTTGLDLKRLVSAATPALAAGFVKNVLEESAWRGYLTEELLQGETGDLRLYVTVGSIWGLWHLPYYLRFLDEATMREVLDVPRLPFALIASATMIGWAVQYTELYRLTRSIWPAVVMHTVEDALVNPLTIDGHLSIDPGRDRLVSPVLGLVTTLGYVAVGLALRAARRRAAPPRRKSTLPAPNDGGLSVSDDDLVLQFIPSLVALLLHHERQKGSPLTEQEVLDVRDNATVMAVPRHDYEAAAAQRGYDDLDPEDVWAEWQQARTELG